MSSTHSDSSIGDSTDFPGRKKASMATTSSDTEKSGKAQEFNIPTSLVELVEVVRSRGITGELIRGSAGSLTVKIGNIALKLAAGVTLARLLGPEGYGVYTYAFTIITVLAIPTQLGLPNLIVRFVAQYQVKERWGMLRGLLRRANQIVLLISILVIGVAGGIIWYIYGGAISEQALTLFWALGLLPLLALGELRSAALRGLRHVLLGLIPGKVARWGVLTLLTLAGYFTFWGGALRPSQVMMLHTFSALLAFLLGAWWLARHFPRSAQQIEPTYEMSKWIGVSLPFLFTGGMQILNNRLDILILGWFWKDAEVGIYEVAVQTSLLVGLGLSASNMLVGPYFSRFYNEGNRSRLQKLVSAAVGLSTLTALPALLLLLGFGPYVLGWVFGADYVRGYYPLVLLCLGQFSHVASGSVGLLLNMTGHERLTLKGVAVATAMNFVLNLVLIPQYGMEGAATATLVTFFLWNFLLVRWAVKELQVNPSVFGLFEQ